VEKDVVAGRGFDETETSVGKTFDCTFSHVVFVPIRDCHSPDSSIRPSAPFDHRVSESEESASASQQSDSRPTKSGTFRAPALCSRHEHELWAKLAAGSVYAWVAQSLGGVAGVAGRRTLRTTSRYFNARERAATAVLRARSEADRQLESGRITGTITGTGLSGRSAEIILPRKNRDGRVAQLDRALPSGAVKESTIPCKKQGILISPGSQKSQQKRIETQPNWHGASYENLDRARRAWGALRVI
jgi:hypothetical protein